MFANEEDIAKIKAIFEYIKGYGILRTRLVKEINKEPLHIFIRDLPLDTPYLKVDYRDSERVSDATNEDSNSRVLYVHKVGYTACPDPIGLTFFEWLKPGWNDFHRPAEVVADKKRTLTSKTSSQYAINNLFDDKPQDEEPGILFVDDPIRIQQFEEWKIQRDAWAKDQKIIEKVRNLYFTLYETYIDLQNNSETQELMVGNGTLTYVGDKDINHPILLKKLRIEFHAKENTIELHDSEQTATLYTELFTDIGEIDHKALQVLESDLEENDFHPLDKGEGRNFLKYVIQKITAKGKFLEENEEVLPGTSDFIFLRDNPVIFVRKKQDGLIKFVDKVLDYIDNNNDVPPVFCRIIGANKLEDIKDNPEQTIDQLLAAVGGEDPDILLGKTANREQLQIAQEIENHDAVLVQGPPGTGKTHTIANLVGHFLSEGKRVLVTSYTAKALTVLKEKVPKEIQSLCVSLLDDSNRDMEKSINGITEYLSTNTKTDLKRRTQDLAISRNDVIHRLADVRRKIFALQHKEYETIVLDGEGISPVQAAKYVHANADAYVHIIPGMIKMWEAFPFSPEELTILYGSNLQITEQEEDEIRTELPNPALLPHPDEVEQIYTGEENLVTIIKEIAEECSLYFSYDREDPVFKTKMGKLVRFTESSPREVDALITYANEISSMKDWEMAVLLDGIRGGAFSEKWVKLCDSIKETYDYSGLFYNDALGTEITINDVDDYDILVDTIKKMQEVYSEKGTIGRIARFFHKEYDTVDKAVHINGKPMKNSHDCELVLSYIHMEKLRKQSARYWNALMTIHGEPTYEDLATSQREVVAQSYVDNINHWREWYPSGYEKLQQLIVQSGVSMRDVLPDDLEIKTETDFKEFASHIKKDLMGRCRIQNQMFELKNILDHMHSATDKLRHINNDESPLCVQLKQSWNNKDIESYRAAYDRIVDLYRKNEIYFTRKKMLLRLAEVAPEWAAAIRLRSGIHGEPVPPSNLQEAWKWKQYQEIIADITAQPFEALQEESVSLEKDYRAITCQLASSKAWYNLLLLEEKDPSMQQNLMGWAQITKKIGKGTGKRAPRFRAEARRLMAKCQTAVPAWIMTIGTALNSLVPGKNMFDVIIVDEASQADLTALAVLYLGKKIIIVGDDKQVSPLAVGMDLDRVTNLIQAHLKDKIPLALQYDGTTSLYDLGKQICHPLMLKEHFRCVPDIIEFSNIYCYNSKIKPLRDASSTNLIPSVISYRVDGERDGKNKINEVEANMTVALIRAMAEDAAYLNKSIGVISMLGNEQARYITRLLLSYNVDVERYKILCGDAAQFQGDERDVIILNLIDNNDSDTPLRMVRDDKTWQRYNVAVSRAKDQLWIIHSLDYTRDLNSDDIRYKLLSYAENPNALEAREEEIKNQSESPFEESVAGYLVSHGYAIKQQWPVGKYRIDMVVMQGDHRVALECDGERYHSGIQKIQEDMERQTILERIGWTFIRLRGSEYYSDPEAAMARIEDKLHTYGIYPGTEAADDHQNMDLDSALKIKAEAYFRDQMEEESSEESTDEEADASKALF